MQSKAWYNLGAAGQTPALGVFPCTTDPSLPAPAFPGLVLAFCRLQITDPFVLIKKEC